MNELDRANELLIAMERAGRNDQLDAQIIQEELIEGKPPRGWPIVPNLVDETLLAPAVQRQILANLIRAYEQQQAEIESLLETLLAASPSLHADYCDGGVRGQLMPRSEIIVGVSGDAGD